MRQEKRLEQAGWARSYLLSQRSS